MSEICYWLLRQQNQLLVSIDDNGVAMFPRARADEFGDLVDPILVGHYQGDTRLRQRIYRFTWTYFGSVDAGSQPLQHGGPRDLCVSGSRHAIDGLEKKSSLLWSLLNSDER